MLRQDGAPCRVGTIDRRGQLAFVGTGQVNLPDTCFPASFGRAEELDNPAIGRPSRRFVLPAIGQQPFTRTIGPHRTHAEVACDAGKGNQITPRAPFRRGITAPAKADPALVAAIGVHHIDLLAA